MKLATRSLPLILAVVGTILTMALPASATFPGKNGRIAFLIFPDVYSMNSDGSDIRQLTAMGPDRFAFNESWSPDGKQLVFNEFGAPEFRGQLWLMNADGSNQRLLLAEDDFDNWTPSFSPDGRWVIFTRCRPDFTEACSVYRMAVEGGNLTALTELETGIQDFYTVYAPDGQSIAFKGSGRGGIVQALYRLVLGEKSATRLTAPPLDAGAPDWSPDGSTIAFSTYFEHTPQTQEIAIVSAEGGRHRLLTNNGHDYFADPHDFLPSWSPQGDAIVFERDAPDFSSSSIFVLKTKSSVPVRIKDIPRLRQRGIAPRHATGGLANMRMSRRLRQIQDVGALPRWGVAVD